MTDIKKGDRVKVSALEGVVTWAGTAGYDIALGDGRSAVSVFEAAVPLVEKIEPPVEVFKPGDVVRDKRAPEYLFAIGKGGYLSISEGQWWPDSAGDTPWDSEHFERVAIE